MAVRPLVGLPVPPRIVDDIQRNDARSLRQFLQNIRERVDDLNNKVAALSSTPTTAVTTRTISSSTSTGSLTEEQVQDIVNDVLQGSSDIDVTYNDPLDTLTLTITAAYTQERDDNAIAYAIALG